MDENELYSNLEREGKTNYKPSLDDGVMLLPSELSRSRKSNTRSKEIRANHLTVPIAGPELSPSPQRAASVQSSNGPTRHDVPEGKVRVVRNRISENGENHDGDFDDPR